VLECHTDAPQATASEGLAQGPYMVARAVFEPMILQTKSDESTDEPPQLSNVQMVISQWLPKVKSQSKLVML